SEEDLLCPKCKEIYWLPVVLNCDHNICKHCLQKFWELKGCRECPVCGAVAGPGRPPINLQLKIAVDKYRTQMMTGNLEACCIHSEKLQFFCHNDEEPICLVCQTSLKHKVHKFGPLEELGLLGYRVWRKMADIIKHVPITLDPNTAQSNLRCSEELTCVQYSKKQLLPDNPERCTNRVCALGATGFTWGKHSWTVDVGQGKDWYIGVAQESINRKSAVFLNPTEGFWVIGLLNGDSYWAETSPRTKLVLKQKPERITIKVDYDRGKVVFINATDLTTIHTFNDRFTEKIFPYFSP
uniref:Uncharacterized protein n=1 Tax=Labrus bergylta TaxID=56723 RepID=A0A3Q3FHS9_9LABR